MSDAPSPQYRPLWLTEEEHQRIFGELLTNPEGLKEERLADLLTKADARSKGSNVKMSTRDGGAVFQADSTGVQSLTPPAALAARRMFFVTVAGLAIITFIGVLASILVRR
jgi:hypothetical protein